MRARGAKVTDIVVLVVAADDGVMPQTKEAIAHSKAAGVPIIIAINKMDKAGADPNRVRTSSCRTRSRSSSWAATSSRSRSRPPMKMNLDKLEESDPLQSEVLELKANPDRPADGVVVEAQLDPGRGSVATVLVQRGTLRVGDVLVPAPCGAVFRRLVDDRGNASRARVRPSRSRSSASTARRRRAMSSMSWRARRVRARSPTSAPARPPGPACPRRGRRGTHEEMIKGIREGTAKELPVLIKADVQGSAEALAGALQRLSTEKVATRVIYSASGGISEADIHARQGVGCADHGFNLRANPQAPARSPSATRTTSATTRSSTR